MEEILVIIRESADELDGAIREINENLSYEVSTTETSTAETSAAESSTTETSQQKVDKDKG